MLNQLFGHRKKEATAPSLYCAIMAQARQAHFFSDWAVADTLDGRFEMLVVHAFLVIRRIKTEGVAGKNLAQQLFDHMFADLDQALREEGVSDVSIPKKIKAMAAAFYGRAAHYEEALSAADAKTLNLTIERNIFPDARNLGNVAALGAYMRLVADDLASQPGRELLAGRVDFPHPAMVGKIDE